MDRSKGLEFDSTGDQISRQRLKPLLLNDVEETGKELGRGAYGVVTEVKVSGTICAGKKLHDAIVQRSTMEKFVEECLFHSEQRHPNIAQLMGVCYSLYSELPMLVMEYLPLSLTQCLEKQTDLPLHIKYSILFDVAKGLNYLHHKRPPIIHCDLTANNVLLTPDYTAKISDLGVSRMIDEFRQSHLTIAPGNAIVMPPEALKDNPQYDHKLDVFSYGCLILHVFTGEFPMPRERYMYVPKPGDRSSFIEVKEWDRRSRYVEKLKQISKEEELISIAKQCLHNDPRRRPEMIEFMDNIVSRYSSSPIDKVELLKEKETLAAEKAAKEEELKQLQEKFSELQKSVTSKTPLRAAEGDQITSSSPETHPQQLPQLSNATTANARGGNVSSHSAILDSGFMPAIVIDTGTRYTKFGFAGKIKPQFVIPTSIAVNKDTRRGRLHDPDFYIGYEANEPGYTKIYPIQRGVVENWDLMEKYWQQCIVKYLRADPKDHFVLLTDSHFGKPEPRERTAEIMFEKFSVPGLCILPQAPLAVTASWTLQQISHSERSLTGLAIDCGNSGTHIIPMVQGCMVHRAVRHMPVSGDDVTAYIHQLLMERGAEIPKLPEHELMEVAKTIKERFSYVCSDIAKEFEKYESQPDQFCEEISGFSSFNNQPFQFNLSSERFMGPEIFFSPELFNNPKLTVSLVQEVDKAIQAAPINVRRDLYKNIVLSGGSTMFRNFGRRIQRDLKRIVTERLEQAEKQCGGKVKPKPIEVNVRSHHVQRYASWFGLSMFGSAPEARDYIITKGDYQEHGVRICHNSPFPFFDED